MSHIAQHGLRPEQVEEVYYGEGSLPTLALKTKRKGSRSREFRYRLWGTDAAVSGFLVPPQAETLLAERIIELLQNPEKRRTMGEKGRILVQTKFAQDRILEQYYVFYRNLGGVPAIPHGA